MSQGEGANARHSQRVAIGILVIGENVAQNLVRRRVFLDEGTVIDRVRRPVVGGAPGADVQLGGVRSVIHIVCRVLQDFAESWSVPERIHLMIPVLQGVGVAVIPYATLFRSSQGEGANARHSQRVAIGILVIGENVAQNLVRRRVFLDEGTVIDRVRRPVVGGAP